MRMQTLALTALLVVACGESPTAPHQERLGQPFELAAGQTAVLASEALRVTFETVSNDSRCPAGATCVWEGDASARFTLAKQGQEKSFVELHTNARFDRQASYHGYRVVLESVRPYPKLNQTIPPTAYVARLRVEAATDASATQR